MNKLRDIQATLADAVDVARGTVETLVDNVRLLHAVDQRTAELGAGSRGLSRRVRYFRCMEWLRDFRLYTTVAVAVGVLFFFASLGSAWLAEPRAATAVAAAAAASSSSSSSSSSSTPTVSQRLSHVACMHTQTLWMPQKNSTLFTISFEAMETPAKKGGAVEEDACASLLATLSAVHPGVARARHEHGSTERATWSAIENEAQSRNVRNILEAIEALVSLAHQPTHVQAGTLPRTRLAAAAETSTSRM